MPAPNAAYRPVTHYENFPVASWLCPAHLRAPIAAIYHYARTADDIADEGQLPVAERLHLLREYRHCLRSEASAPPSHTHWQPIMAAVHDSIARFGLPQQHFEALLDAFEQDVRKTGTGHGYADRAELLDYCARSANPVGRLVLHLHGVDDETSLQQSDAICTALQLINFWQDLQHDIPRGRWYVPEQDASAFGISRPTQQQALAQGRQPAALTNLMAELVQWTRACMEQGAPLVHRLRGRTGWELRVVVQGGLRVLEKMEQSGYECYIHRPTITRGDIPTLLWRAWRM
ncbi:squalene synthase HpnC [Allofranklinella schreckenbergeri]|uniref:Squalene synthase HpnC n=1 Tax=Allofranklinella schreckenbergeri TaxID=1076744 RepID=A0A3M6Q8Q3_9BURK|nr:squalene synthase HpnC [Allofranklinella schreckenbergeri]RMW98778.1 squalene synthase HpnC [Allofranklinella schreckenbergeri]